MENGISARRLSELIEQRRSVFPQHYTGERIDDDVVKDILESARWAPTHKLTEPWRFIVFTGDGIRAFAKFQSDLYKTVTSGDGTFTESKYEKLLTKPLLSSHIIAVLMKRDPRKSVPEVEEIGAVFCAVQNIYLSAAAHGLGGYLSTGGITYFQEAKAFFNLGSEDRIIGFFHLGIPARNYPASKRKPLAEVCEWVTTD